STATATKGSNSQALNLVASAFNSTNATAQNETFSWQGEPSGNNTASPSGTLNLLFGAGATKPAETGLKIPNNGHITFATGQAFSGDGSALTGVNASQLGGTAASGFAKLASTNTFTNAQTITAPGAAAFGVMASVANSASPAAIFINSGGGPLL